MAVSTKTTPAAKEKSKAVKSVSSKSTPIEKKVKAPSMVEKKITMESDMCCTPNSCSPSSYCYKTIVIILLIANLVCSIVSLKTNNIRDVIEDIEAMKVGGEENYAKLQTIMESDAYKANYAQNLDMMMLQIEQANSETTSGEDINSIVTNDDSGNKENLELMVNPVTNAESRGDE